LMTAVAVGTGILRCMGVCIDTKLHHGSGVSPGDERDAER
jgi:hypothetical protein